MGCAGGEKEKLEKKILSMKLERMEIQMKRESELKKLADIDGYRIKIKHLPDYIDPQFAREKKIDNEVEDYNTELDLKSISLSKKKIKKIKVNDGKTKEKVVKTKEKVTKTKEKGKNSKKKQK